MNELDSLQRELECLKRDLDGFKWAQEQSSKLQYRVTAIHVIWLSLNTIFTLWAILK